MEAVNFLILLWPLFLRNDIFLSKLVQSFDLFLTWALSVAHISLGVSRILLFCLLKYHKKCSPIVRKSRLACFGLVDKLLRFVPLNFLIQTEMSYHLDQTGVMEARL
ncbi:hypothetical protein AMTRI_Chr01g109230 [Amborella trichopoda]